MAAVDRAELPPLVGPLVPDAHPMVAEVLDVGVAGEEPEQLVHDRLEVQALGRDQREARREIEAHLVREHAPRSGAGAVGLYGAVLEHVAHHLEVLLHRQT